MIHNISVKQFTIDDWPALKDFTLQAKAHPSSWPVETSLSQMKRYAIRSLNDQTLGFFLLEGDLFDDEMDFSEILGVATATLVGNPTLNGTEKHCYILASFIFPSVKNVPVPAQAGTILLDHINDWAKDWGCTKLCINVRPDGPVKGFERKYKFKPRHVVMDKDVE